MKIVVKKRAGVQENEVSEGPRLLWFQGVLWTKAFVGVLDETHRGCLMSLVCRTLCPGQKR